MLVWLNAIYTVDTERVGQRAVGLDPNRRDVTTAVVGHQNEVPRAIHRDVRRHLAPSLAEHPKWFYRVRLTPVDVGLAFSCQLQYDNLIGLWGGFAFAVVVR